MESAKNLVTILDILNDQWKELEPNLSEETMLSLKSELDSFVSTLNSTTNSEEINEHSNLFIETLSKIKPLEFLEEFNKTNDRSGDIPDLQEEIRIKIINYCVTLKEKLEAAKKEK